MWKGPCRRPPRVTAVLGCRQQKAWLQRGDRWGPLFTHHQTLGCGWLLVWVTFQEEAATAGGGPSMRGGKQSKLLPGLPLPGLGLWGWWGDGHV